MTTTSTRSRKSKQSRSDLPTLGPGLVKWMERNLVHGPGDLYGKPYRLDPWMKRVVYEIYRYDPVSFVRPVRKATIGIAKGNAKTEFTAALAVTEAAAPTVPGPSGPSLRVSPDVPVAAASRDQANLCFGAATAMIEQGPLAPFFETFQYEIRLKGRAGKIYRIAAVAGSNDGSLPTAFVADELHEWQGEGKTRVHTVITNSLAKRRSSGLEINISTAGDPELSDLLLEKYELGQRLKAGEFEDDSLLFVWFEPSNAEVDLNDPEALRVAIREANPSSWIDVEQIARRWEVDKIKEHVFRRYHLNQWVTTGEQWLPSGTWEARRSSHEVRDGDRVLLTFDGSYNGDSTVLLGTTIDTEIPHFFEVGVWERPPDARDDWRVPRSEVDAKVDDAFRRYDVVELACDPARWTLYLDEWVERYGDDRVVEYPNTRDRMMPATAKLYDAAVDGLVTHDGSPVLARHVANAVIKPVPRGYILQKDHPNRKIDAAVCAVMGYDRATSWKELNNWVSIELV